MESHPQNPENFHPWVQNWEFLATLSEKVAEHRQPILNKVN